MRKYHTLFALVLAVQFSFAQKVDFKNGVITVDGKDWAKMTIQKQNFGLTKSFEIFSMSGEKMIIAVPATEFEQDKSDNSVMFYRLTFLTSDQIGIFKLASLSQEKSFLKLIGTSGIVVDGKTDDQKVKEFIAMKGASPRIAVDYTTVPRDPKWPLRLKADKTIEQQSRIIGSFKNTGFRNEQDYYEFMLPSGVIIAKLNFTGGNNAQNFELFTAKDNLKRIVPIPTKDKIIAADTSIDKNQFSLQRIAKWLVDNQYL
jgi:hypothetical protein